MKFLSLFCLILLQTPAFAQSKYLGGKDHCKDVQKKESGKWLEVPQDYKKTAGPKTEIYHWYLGNKHDPKKPTIVYVVGGPGGTSHAYQSWHDQVAKLGYNVLFFDQRGYVCSRPQLATEQANPKFYSVENTARDMEELRKSLGIKKWVVYGHSFGTPISYKYASMFPDSVSSLILEGPAILAPDEKEHYDAFKKRILEKTKTLITDPSCVENNSSEFEQNIQTLASVAGMAGARSYIDLVNSKYTKSRTFPTDEETDSLINATFEKVSKGAHVFPGAEKFSWETENTELIIDNDFPCSDLSNREDGGCSLASKEMKKTFDARKFPVTVPTYFFLGEFDGTPIEQIQDLKKTMKAPNYLIEVKDAGHGTFQDVVDHGGEKATIHMASIFKKAVEGQPIEQKDLESSNGGRAAFALKLHP